jgi:chemotaxis protein CheX
MSTTQTKPSLDPKLILPFVSAVRNLMTKMLGVEAIFDRPRVKNDSEASADFSGIVAFSGTILGVAVLSLHRETAMKLVEKFIGFPVEPEMPDFADAIGELTNMIAGGAKKDLGANANISVPSVVVGQSHRVARPSNIPCLVIPCKTSLGDFEVEICIKSV